MASSEETLCVRCARRQKTCCQTREIYCGAGDKRRIVRYVGREDFYRFAVAAPDYLDQDDDPPYRDWVFRPDGSRRILKKQTGGDCVFLSPAGCALPMDVRPIVCRLHPLDYDHRRVKAEFSDGCPTDLLTPGETLLDALGMRPEDAERWRRQLYAELPLEAEDEDREDLRR